jgi:organic radical activating enzyme
MRITFITNPHSCNQSCDICFSKQVPLDWEPVQEMDFSVVEKVVNAFLPLGLKEIIPSTIGEPFLYSRFEDFLLLAKKTDIKVSITTNGTFPNGGSKKWLPLLLPVLSDIKFSAMHGKIPQSVFEFIDELRIENGEWRIGKFTITIQATLDKNDKLDEIPEGVDRVKINEPWILNSQLPVFDSQLKECRFLSKDIWVWVDGTFQVCPNPDARFGMRTKFLFGDFGNFATQEPLSIWNGAAYRNFCENYKENAICKNCKMRCLS